MNRKTIESVLNKRSRIYYKRGRILCSIGVKSALIFPKLKTLGFTLLCVIAVVMSPKLKFTLEYPIRYPPKPMTQSRIIYAIHLSSPPRPKAEKGLCFPEYSKGPGPAERFLPEPPRNNLTVPFLLWSSQLR